MGQTTQVHLGKIETGKLEEEMGAHGRGPRPNGVRPRKGLKPLTKGLLIGGGLLLFAGLVVGGIIWSQRGVVTVQTGKVTRQDLKSIATASGQIEPPTENFASVNANSFGKITEILVKEGDHVKKGQLLMRTEDIQQTADVDAQQAALRSAQANASVNQAAVASAAAALKTSQADLVQAQAKYKQAHDDFTRGQELFKDQLIARQVFDQRLSDYQVAEAGVQSAQARVAQAKAQYQQAVFNRDMAKASVSQNRARLLGYQDARDKTIYTSPLTGIVTSLPVHVGENVVPGIQNAVGSLLFQVSDLSIATAEVDVDETDIINVKLGQPAEVLIDAYPDQTFKGHVTEIGQSAINSSTGVASSGTNSSTEAAKDFQVRVTLDHPPSGLRPGLSATAKITTATRTNAVAIPIQALTIRTRRELEEAEKNSSGAARKVEKSAVSSDVKDKGKEELQGVFVLKNGRAIFEPVQTGIMGTVNVEVTKGLKAGEEIVTGSYEVLRTLKTGTKVKVDNSQQVAPLPGSSTS